MGMSDGDRGGRIDFVSGGFVCTLAWSSRGVREFHFRKREGREALQRQGAGHDSLPSFVRRALGLLSRYFSGSKVDFGSIPLDIDAAGDFRRKVFREVRRIPFGKTASYGEIAKRAGSAGASRAVGMCMKTNPLPIFIPCHRVIRKNGEPGGFSSPGGAGMKLKLLRAEGVMLVLLAVCLICGACCGAPAGTCGSASAARHPWEAEFTFSNLCNEKVIAERIEVTVGDVTILYPPDGASAPQGVPFGQDAPLGEAYFLSGSYTLAYAVTLKGEGAPGEPLAGSETFTVGKEPFAVEITLRRQEGGCGVRVGVTGSGSGESLCHESPPETKPEEPPCEGKK